MNRSSNSELTCTRRLRFSAGHRLVDFEGPCSSLHGHNYVVIATVEGVRGEDGLILDLTDVKKRLGNWLDEHWDHAILLWDRDEEVLAALRNIPGQRISLLPCNTTVENLADHLLSVVCPPLFVDLPCRVRQIELHETENNSAVARLGSSASADGAPGFSVSGA